MTTLAEAFALALQHHRAGSLQRAEQLYLQILQADPNHSDAHHMLGVLECQAGRYDQAVAAIQRALALEPQAAVYHANLGVAHEALGRIDEAAASYRQALYLRPADADSHYNLGNVLRRQEKIEEAVRHYRQAIRLKPDYAQAHSNLGLALRSQGKFDDALVHYREALRLNPQSAEMHSNLGTGLADVGRLDEAVAHFQEALRINPDFPSAHYNLGCALNRQNKPEEAIRSLEQAVRINPRYAEAYHNLGYILERQNQLEDAENFYRQALQINPDYAEAYNNLGNTLDRQNKLEEAIHCYRQALNLKANFAECTNNIGTVRMRQGNFREALAAYDNALGPDPQYPPARLNRALLRLLLGDFDRGWPDFEWRWHQPGGVRKKIAQAQWDGGDLGDRTILLYAEQGLGDTLQFIRYVPLVQQRGGNVIVQCQSSLLPLLANASGVNRLVGAESPLPAFDVVAPLLSLPGIMGTSLTTVPATGRYLRADQGLVETWQRELKPQRGFKVGIAWQGNPEYRYDRQRSIPLRHFTRLAEVAGVQLISLQKGPGSDQLGSWAGNGAVIDLGSSLDDDGAFMDTAAVMINIDLVISSDSAVPHLAGALGVPVWLALPLVPDWRWLLEREDCPWYPTMRLFRQTRCGDWENVFGRMAEELKALQTRL